MKASNHPTTAGSAGIDARPWQSMAIRSLICLLAGSAGWWIHDREHGVSTAFYMVAFLFGAWDLAMETWEDLRKIRFDTHFLMLLVVPATVALGAWGEGAFLLFLFSASSAMEAFADGRTRREIQSLLHGAPKTAIVVQAGDTLSQIPVEQVVPGQTIRILPGEQIPVDSVVTHGHSAADESSLTGESFPVPKTIGDSLSAGTMNVWGALDARVERPASESALQKIIHLIESAQHLKAPSQRFADRFGTWYTGLVVLACLAFFAFLVLFAKAPPWFSAPGQPAALYRAMTLLVVLSPCALVLSVPSAVLSAIASGARQGILFRGGSAVERLAGITHVAMDKTGTLTDGNMKVSEFEVISGNRLELLQMASSLAAKSNHPISRSILHECDRLGLAPRPLDGLENIPGEGLRLRNSPIPSALGNRELLSRLLGPEAIRGLPAAVPDSSEAWILVGTGLARFILRDQLRPESAGLVAALHQDGVHTVLLTGDRAAAAERIASETGVESVIHDLKPSGKVQEIERIRSTNGRIAMIGDGVNDAPCIAAADVGVAMGARGSDAAIEQADIVLLHDRLENFIRARNLSIRARRIIRQNLVVSLGFMVLMSVITVAWKQLPLWVGVVTHEGGTVLVVLNSLRLLFSPRKSPTESRWMGPGPQG